jgi:hypothetical protein
MTRGLGRIERAILANIASSKRNAAIGAGQVERADVSLKDDDSSVHITAWTLVHECFGPRNALESGWTPSRSQIKACMRAMHSIARKFPQYAIIARRGPKGIVLYEIADPVSMLRAKCEYEDQASEPFGATTV